ncbi:MAG: hypothetical protein ACREQY_14695, partial [Candidatus Binatia bacterium]
ILPPASGIRRVRCALARAPVSAFRVLSFALVLASGAPSPSPSAVQTADPEPSSSALRFDGIYLQQGSEEVTTCWRFYPDGTAADARGPLDRPETCASNMDTSLRYGGPPRYRYTLDGQRLVILQDGSEGTAEGQVLRLHRGHFAYECRFVADSALKAATETATASATPAAGAPASSPRASVALGRATMDESCQRVDFTAAASPARFPALTTEICYRITVGLGENRPAADLRVEDNLKCSTPGLQSRTCNEYGIVNGEPALTSSTIIVRCSDGRPFQPGSYEMAVISGGRRTRSIPFTIDTSKR